MIMLLVACVLDRTGQSGTATLVRDVAMQGARLGNVEASLTEAERRVVTLENMLRARSQQEVLKLESVEELRTEVARLRGDLEVLQHEATSGGESTSALLDDAQFRLTWLESRATQLEGTLGIAPTAPPELDPDTTPEEADPEEATAEDTGVEPTDEPTTEKTPEEVMALAEEHLAAGRGRAAEAVLSGFLANHPDHERAAEAKYRFAEAAFNNSDYKSAVLRFQKVIDDDKKSPWAPWAMLRQGECFEVQGQTDNATLFYEDLIRIWPKSKAAREAKQKLSQ